MPERTVLIVEDDPSAGRLIASVLSSAKVNVEVVTDGLYALQSLRHATPDLVILDIALPRVDGWEVLNTLQQAQRKVPVIVVTAHGQGSSAERAFETGADRFFEKPFVPAELAAAATELLAAAEEGEEPAR
jgi:two-component system response regulator TctD